MFSDSLAPLPQSVLSLAGSFVKPLNQISDFSLDHETMQKLLSEFSSESEEVKESEEELAREIALNEVKSYQ